GELSGVDAGVGAAEPGSAAALEVEDGHAVVTAPEHHIGSAGENDAGRFVGDIEAAEVRHRDRLDQIVEAVKPRWHNTVRSLMSRQETFAVRVDAREDRWEHLER